MKILLLMLMAINASDHMKKFEKHVCPIENPQMALKFQMISATHKNYRVALPFEMIPLNDDMFIAQHKQNKKITILHEQSLPQEVDELVHKVVEQCTLPLNDYTFAVDFARYRVHVVAQNQKTQKTTGKQLLDNQNVLDYNPSESLWMPRNGDASQRSLDNIPKMLLQNGAEFRDDHYPSSALSFATRENMKKTTMFLLRQDQEDVNQYSHNGWTPFQQAVEHNHVESVSFMLENNEPDLMKRTKAGDKFTIFHLVKSKEMLNLLISKPNGREALEKLIEETDYYTGWTPLHQAAVDNLLDVCKSLVKAGANVFTKDKKGRTAYELSSNPKLKKYLEEMKAKPKCCII